MKRIGSKREAAPVDVTRVPIGIDNTTFFSPQIPEEVINCVPILHSALATADGETITAIVDSIGEYMHDVSAFEAQQEFISQPQNLSISDQDFTSIISGLYQIMRRIIRNKVHTATALEDLKKMFVPGKVVDAVIVACCTPICRQVRETEACHQRIRFPRLEKLRWRVDVTLSSGLLSRIMRPSILMQMVLGNKAIKTFEISIEQFNQLRYGAAKVLHDMQILERHPIVKIVKEFERRDCDDRMVGLDPAV